MLVATQTNKSKQSLIIVNASTPAAYVEKQSVQAADIVIETGNVVSLTPFLTLNARDGVCLQQTVD